MYRHPKAGRPTCQVASGEYIANRRCLATMYPNTEILRRDVSRRLRRGENMVLYGPHGIGKTTLLLDLEARLRKAGIPCGRSAHTGGLDDVTRALEAAYPTVDTALLTRRGARSQLWQAADIKSGVLLLDHLTDVTNAMVSYLRRLRGGLVGVLTAVDVEIEKERWRMKPWRMGALSVRMPLASADLLRELLHRSSTQLGLPQLEPDIERRLVRAAEGRPGWILECTRLQTQRQYWQGSQLFVSILCTDTEIALRQGSLDMLPPMRDREARVASLNGD